MKSSFFGTLFAALFVGYLVYVFLPSSDYKRIQHACAPINMFGKTVKSGEVTLSESGEAQTVSWFQKAEHNCQLFVYHRFYAE